MRTLGYLGSTTSADIVGLFSLLDYRRGPRRLIDASRRSARPPTDGERTWLDSAVELAGYLNLEFGDAAPHRIGTSARCALP